MSHTNRFEENETTGLSTEQVLERVQHGLTNEYMGNTTKSHGQIVKDHLFTFFNILNIVLVIFLFAVGAYKDISFVIVVVVNFFVGVIQEFSSKRTLDKLALIVAARACVIRDGKKKKIPVAELVQDDVMELSTGNQICADARLMSGVLEVNESMLTGESDVVVKKAGDVLYSGSFVVAGRACARVERVGEQSYANKISASAKAPKRRYSQLYATLNGLLKVISYVIVPLGVLLYYKQHVVLGLIPDEAVVKTVAGIIGMIPEGLILATSISFLASVIFLGKDQTLVQDMYGIETFARADVMCLDKTGTLTCGELSFDRLVVLGDSTKQEVERSLRHITGASPDENATMQSIKRQYAPLHEHSLENHIPFSSQRKYSGVEFAGVGSYVLGATEYVFPGQKQLAEQAQELAKNGKRVLVLAHTHQSIPKASALPGGLQPMAFLLLADQVRSDAKETLAYFYSYDMDVKIISGDNPQTVAHIAAQAGVRGADRCIDASTLTTEEELRRAVLGHSVFGRVSPEQKMQMVQIMRKEGLKVSMMGDGVNDVLALKEADCSVAVAAGSDAAKNVSDIVLMDSGLIHLLHVLEDGRKIINNSQRVATLFITKTVYSAILAVAALFLFRWAYPFTPLQLAFSSFVTIGAPAFFLALEPQYDRIKDGFMRNVLKKSLPGGLCIALCIMLVTFFGNQLHCTPAQMSTLCMYLMTAGGLWVLLKASLPLTRLRKIVLVSVIGFFALCVWLFPDFFEMVPLQPAQVLVAVIILAAMPVVMLAMERLIESIYELVDRGRAERSHQQEQAHTMRKTQKAER